MNYFRPLYPFLFVLALIVNTTSFFDLGILNGLGQLLLFTFVVCIPIWRTGRMSYVDIGWPWGLVLLGIISFLFSDGNQIRSLMVSMVLVLVGLRMGLGALKMWYLGLLEKEFPRYQYQRLRWVKEGKKNTGLALQIDAISQGLANASFLALPIFIVASNSAPELFALEILGLLIWALAFTMESIADMQKLRFLKAMKKQGKQRQVCNVGLWRYCRHPNYFAEWMVWNALILISIPSLSSYFISESSYIGLGLLISLIYISRIMYTTLVYYTGAVPSEYYSVQKRPDYKSHQQTTNMFFPGKPKKKHNN